MPKARVLLLAAACLAGKVVGQPWNMGVPHRPDGVTFNKGSPAAPVQIDLHFDMLCPDCKAADPHLKAVAKSYGSDKVRLVFHLFPLPYHQYGFTAAQAGVVVLNSTDAEGFFRFQEEAFKMQELLWNEAAQGYTQPQVAHVLKPLALKAGVSEAQWKQGMGEGHGGTPADSYLRGSWKYGTSRGVSGTPAFFVNGVAVPGFTGETPAGDYAYWNETQWKQLIDPLLSAARRDGL